MRDCPARDAGTNFNRRIFSFHLQNLMRKAGSREHFLLSIFELVTCHLPPGTGTIRAMKISIATDHNSVCDVDRISLVCANIRLIARCRHELCGGFERPAESAGDDETDDGDVEIQ